MEAQRDWFVCVMRCEERQTAFRFLAACIDELAPVLGILEISVVERHRSLPDAPRVAQTASGPAQADRHRQANGGEKNEHSADDS